MKIKDCYVGKDVAFRMKTSETDSLKVIGKIVEINKDLGMVLVESKQCSGVVPCDILLGAL